MFKLKAVIIGGVIVALFAAVAAAEYIAGSEPDFVKIMNARAKALGMSDTLFGNASGLPDNQVVALAEDAQGNIWIGTNDHGLIFWDVRNQKMKYYESVQGDPNTLSTNNIKTILVLEDNSLLVGTHLGGLNHFYPDRKVIVYKEGAGPGSIASNNAYCLLKDHEGDIWVGTFRGLQKFDPNQGYFTSHYIDSKGTRLTSDQISFLYNDTRNRIWIGTDDGLNILFKASNSFISFRNIPGDSASIAGNHVTCISEDRKGRIWIGTNNGLNLYEESSNSFKRYTVRNGLPNDFIYGILEDDDFNLWISSNGGLTKMNPETGFIQNFYEEDGIQSNQFNNYSFAKTSDGMLLFGGINGITAFYPDQIRSTPFNRKVIITQLLINNDVIQPYDRTGILEDHISNSGTVTFEKHDNSFSLRFVAINYLNTDRINYQYKLEGLDDNWNNIQKMRTISCSNLSPGDYTLKLKPDIHGEPDINEITKLNITILSPWWATKLAIVFYIILALMISFLIYRIIVTRIKTHQALKIERMEKQQLEEVNEMKLQFFTNISHEFKTPLTLIISPLEKLRESRTRNEWYNKQIDLVYKNARRLLTLVDQLMEFRKAEMGQLKLKVIPGDIVAFLYDIYHSFTNLAQTRDITFTFDKNVEKLEILFDRTIIEKIMFNLLSNAFKYTPSGGHIGLIIRKTNKTAVISVSDTGKGIPQDKQALIFDRFYSADKSNPSGGSGIGLAFTSRLVELHHGSIRLDSAPGTGSTFYVDIPLYKEVYPLSEISEEHSSEVIDHKIPVEFEDELKHFVPVIDGDEEKERILIVDDNIEILNYLYDNLSEIYNVETANDGIDALEKIKNRQYDLIVSDVMMPRMDGMALCKKIKQNIKTCHIPFILLTVKASIDDQVEGHEIGADEYLGKPFSLRVLESKISNLIKSRKRLKEIYSEKVDFQPEDIAYNDLDQEFLEKAMNVVLNHLSDQEFSVDVFASEMFISRSNLHLKFKAITGDSASEFIKKIRFSKAVELLKTGKYNISEISYMVGFTSPSYFSSRFKKYFGHLPTDYRKKR